MSSQDITSVLKLSTSVFETLYFQFSSESDGSATDWTFFKASGVQSLDSTVSVQVFLHTSEYTVYIIILIR